MNGAPWPLTREEAERFVRTAFEGLLCREADEPSLAEYAEMLIDGRMSPPDLLRFFGSLNEFYDHARPQDMAHALSALYSGEGYCGDPFLWRDGDLKLVVFHFPKTAGMALRRILMGQFHPLQLGHGGGRDREPGARYGRYQKFYCGHMSWAEYEGIEEPKCTLTVLREPAARLVSLYRFLALLGASALPPFDRAAVAARRGPEDFVRSADPAVRNVVDNHYVRTLAGAEANETVDPLREDPEGCLERALGRVLAFDDVLFVEEVRDRQGALPDRVANLLEARFGFRNLPPLPREHVTPALDLAPISDEMIEEATALDRRLCRAVARELGFDRASG